MRKLLVALLSVVVVVGLFAGEANVTGKVSWSGSVLFTAVMDEKGIDIQNAVSVYVTWNWSPLSASVSGKVSAAVYWGFDATGYAGLSYISYENDLLKLTYKPFGFNGDDFFALSTDSDTYGLVGNDQLAIDIKPAKITVYYADLVEETDTDTGTPSELADKFFNDYVAVKGVFGPISFFGAFYDTTDADAEPAYEYGVAVYYTGEGALEGLTVKTAFGTPASTDVTAYGVIASYVKTFDLGFMSLTFSNTFSYTENLAALKYNTVTDAKSDSFSVSVEIPVSALTISGGVNGSYGLVDGALSLGGNGSVSGSFDPVSFSVSAEIPDLINKATDVSIEGNVSASLDPISFSAGGKYTTADNNYAYFAKIEYNIDEALSLCAFYGTYYDKDGDGYNDMNPDDPQWYVKLSYSASF